MGMWYSNGEDEEDHCVIPDRERASRIYDWKGMLKQNADSPLLKEELLKRLLEFTEIVKENAINKITQRQLEEFHLIGEIIEVLEWFRYEKCSYKRKKKG
ncbi:MAG: hypothetical protein WC631_03220 [Candidatus Paceibacterota bacterium]|jgi:hypothetical protein